MIDTQKYINELLETNPKIDPDEVQKALDIAIKMHEGQLRKDDSPYITHPMEVAKIVNSLGLDTSAVVGALLHDAVEDTPYDLEDVKNDFGEDVAILVDGVTKLDKLKFDTNDEHQAKNIRKMFLAMSKNIRVLVIKLADKLHNLRTIEYTDNEQIRRKCEEAIDVYAPLAGRLGISKIKIDLEDIALKHLHADIYEEIANQIDMNKEERKKKIDQILEKIRSNLKEQLGLEPHFDGRAKHFYSIYKKIIKQHKNFENIYDIMAVRIITDTKTECYEILGQIHIMFKPVPGRFKDYIATPKANGYQSIHTTVMDDDGMAFEVQIRTHEMNKVAEYGIAAHWKYKEKIPSDNEEEKIGWLKQAFDWLKEMHDGSDFLDALKTDIFADQIFVFTPKGEVVELPKGSTPIDFAFKIHSDIGFRLSGAKVNNNLVPLKYHLQHGDKVEIVVSKDDKVSVDWLIIAKSKNAISKIRAYLRKTGKIESLDIKEHKPQVEQEKNEKEELGVESKTVIDIGTAQKSKTIKERGDIKIEGVEHGQAYLIKLGKCCNPLPEDEIIGFVTRSNGITIHRKDCPNVKGMADSEKERLIKAEWDLLAIEDSYETKLVIVASDRRGIISDITRICIELDVEILTLKMDKPKLEKLVITISVQLLDLMTIDKLLPKLKQIVGVLEVERM